MRVPDLRAAARLYCATTGAVLIAFGLDAWDADPRHPVTGALQTKMSYVHEVDGLYAGCGVYKNLVG